MPCNAHCSEKKTKKRKLNTSAKSGSNLVSHNHKRSLRRAGYLSEHLLDLTVQHQHQGRAHGTQSVGSGALEEGGDALLLADLVEAINGALVDPLGLRLLGLHLQTTTDGVEGVGSVSSKDGSELGNAELGGKAYNVTVLLVGVHVGEGIEHAEVHATVGDDAHDRHTEAIVQSHNTRGSSSGLDKAITQAVEALLARAHIGGKTGTGIVQGVDNAQRSSTSKTTGSHVDGEELGEFLFLISLGENILDHILEGKVEGLGREVTKNVGEVSTPESSHTLLSGHTSEAITYTRITLDLARHDVGVGILSLDDQLDTLDGGSASLGDSAADATSGEILQKGHSSVRHDFRSK